MNRPKLPPLGGTLTISIVEAKDTSQNNLGHPRSPKARFLAELQQISKLGSLKPSDDVEGLKFQVSWQPSKGVLGVSMNPADVDLVEKTLTVVCRFHRGYLVVEHSCVSCRMRTI